MSRARGGAMLSSMMTYYRAWENRRFVRRLLREKQPEFAAALESVVREPPCLRCRDPECWFPAGHARRETREPDISELADAPARR